MHSVKGIQKERYERKEQRIKSLYFFLKSEKTAVNINDLADMFGYSAATLTQDLELLRYNNLVIKSGRGMWQFNSLKKPRF